MRNLILLGFVLSSSFVFGAIDKGNGIDIVKCDERGKGKFRAKWVYRTFDSAEARDSSIDELVYYKSSEDAIEKTLGKLEQVSPRLAGEYREFVETFEAKSNEDKTEIWRKGSVKQISDENDLRKIPAHCKQEFIQTVARDNISVSRSSSKPRGTFVFNYDENNLHKIINFEAEKSWMLWHEFSWRYVRTASAVRLSNAYIHSQNFLDDDVYEVARRLSNLGNYGIEVKVDLCTHISSINDEAKKYLAFDDSMKKAMNSYNLELDFLNSIMNQLLEKASYKRSGIFDIETAIREGRIEPINVLNYDVARKLLVSGIITDVSRLENKMKETPRYSNGSHDLSNKEEITSFTNQIASKIIDFKKETCLE